MYNLDLDCLKKAENVSLSVDKIEDLVDMLNMVQTHILMTKYILL